MNYKEELENAILSENLYETNDILEKIVNEQKGKEYLEYLINLIADNPNIDFGIPGTVVHFIERYPEEEYVSYLIIALNDKPNSLLLWMLNRIVNEPNCTKKEEYIMIFDKISKRKDIDMSIRNNAKGYFDFQRGC